MDIYSIEKPFGLLDDETKAAMKAHKDAGGKFEWFNGEEWTPTDRFTDGSAAAHRAARSPRVIWVNEYPRGFGNGVFDSECEAKDGAALGAIRTVKFVEVK